MAERPVLSDTADPFELLGVARDCDMREAKRAYVRLIKDFRPDEYPEEFQRIRTAFEDIRGLLKAGADSAKARRDSMPFRPSLQPAALPQASADAAPAQPVSLPSNAPGDDAAAGIEPPRSQDSPGAPHGERPSVPEVALPSSAAMTVDLGHSTAAPETPPETVDEWVEALEAGRPLARHARHLYDALLSELSRIGALRWAHLRQQPDQGFARALFIEGARRRLLAGDVEGVLHEFASPDLAASVEAYEALAPELHTLLQFTAWEAPHSSRQALEDLGAALGDTSEELDWLDRALELSVPWQAAASGDPQGRAYLRRFLQLSSMQTDAGQEELCALLEALPGAEASILVELDTMAPEVPELWSHCLAAADRVVPADDRLLDELSPEDQAHIAAEVQRLDTALAATFVERFHSTVLGFMLLGALASFFPLGWHGLWVVLSVFVFMMATNSRVDRYLYRRVARPFLVRRLATQGIAPERVVEAIAANTKLTDSVGRFDGEVEDDSALPVLAALYRLRFTLLASRAGDEPVNVGRGTEYAARDAASLGTCAQHPDRPRVAVCEACGTRLCASCQVLDPQVGPHCRACDPARKLALRRACANREKGLRVLAVVDVFVGLFVVSVMAATSSDAQGLTVGLALAAFPLLAAVGLRLHQDWSRHVQLALFAPLLFAFPVGTWVVIGVWRFLYAAPTRRVLTPEYRALVKVAPALNRPIWLRWLEWATWLCVPGTALLLLLR